MPTKRKPKTPKTRTAAAQAEREANSNGDSNSPLVREILNEANEKPYERIWLGFLTTRIVVGVLLSLSFGLQLLLNKQLLGLTQHLSFWLALGYLAAAIAARLLIRQAALLRGFSLSWAIVIGIDLLVFSTLHLLRTDGMNMLPLLLLPVLEAAILGSLLLAMGTAALVTIAILLIGWLLDLRDLGSSQLLQAAGSGAVFFVLAYLANQLASRLEREEQNSRQIQELARTQAQVNQLIIDAIPSGIVVVGRQGQVFGSNPAARALLGLPASKLGAAFQRLPSAALRDLMAASFADGKAHEREVVLASSAGDLLVKARAQITDHDYESATGLVLGVLFLQDLREEQAKARTEKLLSMGRMSAAVAHEIRNPLAAIAQANALLAEELTDPVPKRLSKMIRDNAARLGRIVDEVLDVARVQESDTGQSQVLALPALVQRIAADWLRQHPVGERLALELPPAQTCNAWFDADHLRRILVNLLDNALRYASEQPAAIVLRLRPLDEAWQELSVWSDGQPLEESLQKHLFEPFFSSESRSSGLGLYICRQLCERHEAKILYRLGTSYGRSGNEFVLYLRADFSAQGVTGYDSTII